MTQTANYLNGVGANSQSYNIGNFACGSYTGGWVTGNDGANAIPMAVHIGFTPRYVKLVNMTTGDQYEWMEGMAATDTLMTTASTGANSIDANSVIVTNSTSLSETEMATSAPGYQGPGEGTTGTVTINVGYPDPSKEKLTFNSTAGASGAPVNANGTLYVWQAWG